MWEEKPLSHPPKIFLKEIPVYEVIKEYEINLSKESINVQRAFSLAGGDLLNICYQGPEYIERLTISKGKIIFAESKLVALMVDLPSLGLDDEEFIRRMGEFFSQSKAKQNPSTHHNIKRFEDYLKELPFEYQDDLSAVYNNNGFSEHKSI